MCQLSHLFSPLPLCSKSSLWNGIKTWLVEICDHFLSCNKAALIENSCPHFLCISWSGKDMLTQNFSFVIPALIPKSFLWISSDKIFFYHKIIIIRVKYSIVSENIRCYIMKLGSPTASNQEAQPRRIDQKRLWLFILRISKHRNRRDWEKQKKTWWGWENVCVLFEWNFLLENLGPVWSRKCTAI